MEKVVLLQYLSWQFLDSPKTLLKAWRSFILFNLNYFSIPVLLRTFFSPWHRYVSPYKKSFSPVLWLETLIFNSFSRIIGAVIRSVFLIIGILLEFAIIVLGLTVFLAWLVLPFSLIFTLFLGIKMILI